MQYPKRRPERWERVKRFEDEDSGYCVDITQDAATPWPKFNIRVGRIVPNRYRPHDDYFNEYIPVFFDKDEKSGKGFIRWPLSRLAIMITDAEGWCLEQQQRYEASRQGQDR